jgi:hypothetical protein
MRFISQITSRLGTPGGVIDQTAGAEAEFTTEIDSEVRVKLALFVFKQLKSQSDQNPSFLTVITNALRLVQGTFGCIFRSALYPDELVTCRLKYPDGSEARPVARPVELRPDGPPVSR